MTDKMNLKKLRNDMGLNQSQFWAAVNVTQSGGSRYESGRKMPQAIARLVELVHIRKIQIDELDAEAVGVIHKIKSNHPDLYSDLLNMARKTSHAEK